MKAKYTEVIEVRSTRSSVDIAVQPEGKDDTGRFGVHISPKKDGFYFSFEGICERKVEVQNAPCNHCHVKFVPMDQETVPRDVGFLLNALATIEEKLLRERKATPRNAPHYRLLTLEVEKVRSIREWVNVASTFSSWITGKFKPEEAAAKLAKRTKEQKEQEWFDQRHHSDGQRI